MPLHSVIHKERRLVVTTAEGRLTLEDVKANQQQLLSDPDFSPEFNQLLDTTAITEMAITVDDIKRAVSTRVFSPTSRRAFVVSSTFMYGMARMIQTYNELSQGSTAVTIFRDRPSALDWLGFTENYRND